MWARREWNDIFKLIKEGNLQSRILYPARLLFRFYGEIKSFTDKKRLKEFSTSIPASMEKALATHSSTLAWKIAWMEEPGRLQSMGMLSVAHD